MAVPDTHARWFLKGMRGLFSMPAIILMVAFVGFSSFIVDAGIPLGEAVFMTGMVWALPAKVLLVGAITAGMSLPAAFLTVALSSIRLMPMVAALIPELRGARTPTWHLLLLSHFIAITAWVFAMERLRDVPRERRVAFFAGFGITLTLANIVLVATIYSTVDALPALAAGALLFMTPVYFLTSVWSSSRDRSSRLAFVIGLGFGPLFHQIAPEFDILYAGLVGGSAAFLVDRVMAIREAA